MLETMMKFGAFRVDYINQGLNRNQKAFGFYLRAEISVGDHYSRDAKHQLYSGLTIIKKKLEMVNLVGIYLDVDSLDNLERPAYQQMKEDMLNGLFKRLFVLDENAILGSLAAEHDLLRLFVRTGGFELFTCKNGECVPLEFARVIEPLAA
jgi:hypothetical protein